MARPCSRIHSSMRCSSSVSDPTNRPSPKEDLMEDRGYERPCQTGMEVPQGSDHGSCLATAARIGPRDRTRGDIQDGNDG
jgi:hypothetical protein